MRGKALLVVNAIAIIAFAHNLDLSDYKPFSEPRSRVAPAAAKPSPPRTAVRAVRSRPVTEVLAAPGYRGRDRGALARHIDRSGERRRLLRERRRLAITVRDESGNIVSRGERLYKASRLR